MAHQRLHTLRPRHAEGGRTTDAEGNISGTCPECGMSVRGWGVGVGARAAGALPTEGGKTEMHAQGLRPRTPRSLRRRSAAGEVRKAAAPHSWSHARGAEDNPTAAVFLRPPRSPHLLSPPPFFPSREQEQKETKTA